MRNSSLVGIGFSSFISLVTFSLPAKSAVLRIGESNFHSDAGLITFSEFPQWTMNPVYSPQNYGGANSSPTIRFGGFFQGQSLGSTQTCPPGAMVTGCVQGSPTGNLTLDANSPGTYIVHDISNPTSPVLSGFPIFNGAISILFSENVAAVGLSGGYFNSIGATAITAFGRDGSNLGSVNNSALGIEFLGLASSGGLNQIAGLQFSLVGPEPAGFAIDNLRFGQVNQVDIPVPTPSPSVVTPIPIPSASTPSEVTTPEENIPKVPEPVVGWSFFLGLGILLKLVLEKSH